jgi:hypothetical protein
LLGCISFASDFRFQTMQIFGFSIWSVVGSFLAYYLTQILSGYVWKDKKADGSPKEPWPAKPSKLPWLWKGLHLLGEEPYKKFTEWSKELGGLYSVQLGSKQLIVANDADLVKELFVDQQQYNSGKITGDLIEATMTDTGKTIGLGLPNENITDQKSSDH